MIYTASVTHYSGNFKHIYENQAMAGQGQGAFAV